VLRWAEGKSLRWLDFDIENRPLTYLGSDFTTAEVTAVAWGWSDQKTVHCRALGECSMEDMLGAFVLAYQAADGVTGHYIRKHDLPILNGALMEAGMPTLGAKLTCDTKLDLVKRKDLSASQESLGEMYGLSHPKEHMSQVKWREANRLTPEGIKETRRRVVGDVKQHQALRLALLDVGALKGPSVWRP
jgi:hypothetical protein